jgi:hypothetical protein
MYDVGELRPSARGGVSAQGVAERREAVAAALQADAEYRSARPRAAHR